MFITSRVKGEKREGLTCNISQREKNADLWRPLFLVRPCVFLRMLYRCGLMKCVFSAVYIVTGVNKPVLPQGVQNGSWRLTLQTDVIYQRSHNPRDFVLPKGNHLLHPYIKNDWGGIFALVMKICK